MILKPIIPIAAPQLGNEDGTWAYRTVSTRFPNTAKKIFEENELPGDAVKKLQDLIDDIPDASIRVINDPDAPDYELWLGYVEPYLGLNWHQPPWFFTEHYFYRRILEAIGYFQIDKVLRVDPFHYQKRKGFENSDVSIHQLIETVETCRYGDWDKADVIKSLLYMDLWGNQADLSLWPADGKSKPDHLDLEKASDHILVNDTIKIIELVLGNSPLQQVDFLIDNAGFELVSDLIFADTLLRDEYVSAIRFHLKKHPTFVSDAMEKDVRASIEWLYQDCHKATQSAGLRLREALKNNVLQLNDDWFWTSPLDGWDMSMSLRGELSKAKLVICKGDAHYRRLLGDRHWPPVTSFAEIMAYFPVSLVALRTLKSELVVGLKEGQDDSIYQSDPEWMINGRWGMVQLFDGSI